MVKEIITFGDDGIKKCKFHYHKKPIFLADELIDKMLISYRVSSSDENY